MFDAQVREAGAGFADVGGLTDGAVIRADRGPLLPDAAILNDAGEICEAGGVTGVACAPDGTGISGAVVEAATVDCAGTPVIRRTETDARGRFRLGDLAPGSVEVTVRSGSFRNRFEVDVLAGVDVPASGGISDKVCLESDSARLAVFTGNYDRIQGILDGLGFDYDLICGSSGDHRHARQVLADAPLLAGRDILFFNCSSGIDFRAPNPEVAELRANLRAFVAGGGSLYVSDLAAGVIEYVWPEYIAFGIQERPVEEQATCCVCTDCAPECRTPGELGICGEVNDLPAGCASGGGVIGRGVSGEIEGQVAAGFLQDAVGGPTVPLVFNASGWVEVLSVAAGVEVLVADPAGAPLMVLFQPYPDGGRIAFTSFHNHTQATAQMRAILAALVLRL